MNIEETAERHVFLGEALVLAERKGEALWHYGRAADLYDDREYKVREARFFVFHAAYHVPYDELQLFPGVYPTLSIDCCWCCSPAYPSPVAPHRFQPC